MDKLFSLLVGLFFVIGSLFLFYLSIVDWDAIPIIANEMFTNFGLTVSYMGRVIYFYVVNTIILVIGVVLVASVFL